MHQRNGPLYRFLRVIWRLVSAKKVIEKWGQSPETVFLRSIIFGLFMFAAAVIFLQICKSGAAWYAPQTESPRCTNSTTPLAEFVCSLSRNFLDDSKVVLGVLGFWWSCYAGFRQEFVSKFEYLTKSLDSLLTSGNYVKHKNIILSEGRSFQTFEIADQALNYAGDCIRFNLQKNASFLWTFYDIMCHIAYLQENDNRRYICLISGHSEVDKFLKKSAHRRSRLIAHFHNTEKVDGELNAIRQCRLKSLREHA